MQQRDKLQFNFKYYLFLKQDGDDIKICNEIKWC